MKIGEPEPVSEPVVPSEQSVEAGSQVDSSRIDGSRSASTRNRKKKSAWVQVVAVLVGLVAVGLIALLATRDADGGAIRAASPLIGELVPPLSGEVIWPADVAPDALAFPGVRMGPEDVARFDIDAVGPLSSNPKWVLVNFFASWCVPCEREHPALATWRDTHIDDGVLVAVPFGDRTSDAVAFYERLGGHWPVVSDPDSRWAVEFGVLRPPESFLITPEGIVAARWQGQISADDPDAVIAALIDLAAQEAETRNAESQLGQ